MAHGSRNAAAQTAATPSNAHASNGVLTASSVPGPVKVNQKKAKRRAKEAAKRQAQASTVAGDDAHVQQNPPPNTTSTSTTTSTSVANRERASQQAQHSLDYEDDAYDAPEGYDGEEYYSDEDAAYQGQYDGAYPAGSHPAVNGVGKKNKKKKKKQDPYAPPDQNDGYQASARPPPPPPPPAQASAALTSRTSHHRNGDHIWNTSTQQERERIKEFWLSLKEEERRSLVKVEKEAVLKKMKEQQKHSCSCTVCGRKRTAIEEELEVLYDAYYEELEQLPPDRIPALSYPSPQRQIMELGSDDEGTYDEDEFSEDYDEDDDYSEEEPEELPRATADFFQFGNSLTVKGGILTVADDLLKNDGKKFIEMMEQLAERRMQREEEAQYAAATHPDTYYNRNHGHGAPEDDEDDDFDDDDYDSQEEFEDEEEEMDTMTEEQRMQEGRRMFQIFAARMFEQRVLTAYREKVAAERQQKLLEELAADDDLQAAKDAKKAKDAEKRKAKKQAQKQKQQEEKARKDKEQAEREAAAKAEQEAKLEEQRKRREEQRLKKEEQRKAQDAEAQRKQAEKIKRQKEEQDRRQEAERKAREQKETERKAREEAKKRERDEREAREKEAKERKARTDSERKEKESKEKVELERLRKETQSVQQAQAVQAAKRAAAPAAVPIPPGLTKQPSSFASPHVQPAVPKAPTPVRPRQGSQQGSKGSSPKTPAAVAGQPKSGSPGVIGGLPGSTNQTQNPPIAPKAILSRPPSQPPISAVQQPSNPSPMNMVPPPGMPMPQQGGAFGMPPPGLNGFPHGPASMMPANMQRNPMPQNMFSPPQQPIGAQFPRPFGPLNGMAGPPPPGMGAPGMPPFGRGLPEGPPPGFGGQLPNQVYPGGYMDTMPARTIPGQHSRHHSGSSTSVEPQAPIVAPIGHRPRANIQRPPSVKPGDQQHKERLEEVDELADHLGSSALLGDDPLEPDYLDRRPSMPPGLQHNNTDPAAFSSSFNNRHNGFPSALGHREATWGTPSLGPFSTPVLGAPTGWPGSPTGGWPSSGGFGLGLAGTSAPSRPRHAQVRIAIIEAYKSLASQGRTQPDGFVDAKSVFSRIQNAVLPPVAEGEMINLLDTEGTSQNGGGYLQKSETGEGGVLDKLLKWTPDDGVPANGGRGVGNIGAAGAGDIGSPVVGPASMNHTPYGSMRGFGGLGASGLAGLGQGL